MADVLASVSVVLGAEISGFRAAMAQARRELSGLVKFSEGLKDVGTSLTAYVSAPITALGAVAVAASARMEGLSKGLQAIAQQDIGKQAAAGLTSLRDAGQATAERIKVLQDIAKAPGIGFEEAVKGDVRLRAVGVTAQESAAILKEFANAIALTGGGAAELNSVTVQLAQMAAKGKVLAQDLRPVIEAAPSAAAALKKLFGTVDSEEISKQLQKAGQSSTDFINQLTAELAKSPRVTGGLANQFENLAQTTTQSLAKVGDAISSAFNLPATIGSLSNGIESLANGFANLSPVSQGFLVALASIAAAAGPVLVAVGTLGAALPALKAGFATLGSATTAVGESLALLAGPVGLAVAAVALLGAGIYYVATASDRALEAYQAQAKQTDELTASITPLLDRYNELTAKTTRTAAEQTELNDVIKQLAASVPGATTAIDDYGNATAISGRAVAEFTQALKDKKAALGALNLPAAQAKLDALATSYRVLRQQADEFNKTGSLQVAVYDEGGGAVESYKAGSQAVLKLQADLATTNVEYLKQKQLVDDLSRSTSGLATIIGTGLTQALSEADIALKLLGGQGSEATGRLAGLRAELKTLKEDREAAPTDALTLAYNPLIKSLEAQISRLEGVDKASKKAADAIAKLRAELAALSQLDDVLATPANGFDTVNRRVQTLESGLKRLLEAGVSPASKVFKAFAAEALALQQGLAKLQASSNLDFKVLTQVKLAPSTLGELYPNLQATLNKELADRPLLVPLTVKALALGDTFSTLNDLRKSLAEIGVSSAAFGSSFNFLSARADAFKTALQQMIKDGISPASAEFKKLVADWQAATAASTAFDAATERSKQAADILKSGVMEMAAGLADAFATITSGSGDFGTVLEETLLNTVANVATQLGQILLASGLGIESLKKALESFTGVGAIAAGLGLIAIGGLARGAAASLANSGGGGGGVSTAVASAPRSYTPTTAPGATASGPTTFTHKVYITANGRDLQGVLELETDRLGRVKGKG